MNLTEEKYLLTRAKHLRSQGRHNEADAVMVMIERARFGQRRSHRRTIVSLVTVTCLSLGIVMAALVLEAQASSAGTTVTVTASVINEVSSLDIASGVQASTSPEAQNWLVRIFNSIIGLFL